MIWLHVQQLQQSCLTVQEVELQGRVVSVDRIQSGLRTVSVVLDQPCVLGCVQAQGKKVRLQYYGPIQIHQGQMFGGRVALKPLSGAHNPGLFDFELWAMAQGYLAAGVVRELSKPSFQQWSFRQPPGQIYAGVIEALASGQKHGISTQLWETFRRTGTVHLVVISGMHVGIYGMLFAGVGLGVVRALILLGWLRESHLSCVPKHKLAACCALLGVWAVAIMTGLQPPVQRAALMSTLAIIFLLTDRGVPHALRGCCVVGALMLFVQPGLFFLSGFWLSFVAVFLLIICLQAPPPGETHLRRLCWFIWAQFVLFLGMAPWVAFFVGEISIVAPVANLVAVPIVTCLTLPLILCGLLLEALATGVRTLTSAWGGVPSVVGDLTSLTQHVWQLADFSIWVLVTWLEVLIEHVPAAAPSIGYYSVPLLLMLSLSALLALLPLRAIARMALVGVFGLLVCAPRMPNVGIGEFQVIQIDVGQGSSGVIRTANHTLLLDTGPAGPVDHAGQPSFDRGRTIVRPALVAAGIHWIDKIMLSHLDADHAGGLKTLVQRFPQAEVTGLQNCGHSNTWEWDGVTFTVLQDAQGNNANDRSCTLIVSNNHAVAFFSGDISSSAERRMLMRLPADIDLLLAPHHGSNSSSSWPLLARLKPAVVFVSAGQFNRYGHPRADVLARYAAIDAKTFVTASDGALFWSSAQQNIVHSSRHGRQVIR